MPPPLPLVDARPEHDPGPVRRSSSIPSSVSSPGPLRYEIGREPAPSGLARPPRGTSIRLDEASLPLDPRPLSPPRRQLGRDDPERDLRHQRVVLRRYRRREPHRVETRLHGTATRFLTEIGDRNLVFADLTQTQEELHKTTRKRGHESEREGRRRLSAWTQGAFQRIVSYQASTAVLSVKPTAGSSECPRCGGSLTHPTWRQSDCGNGQGHWHRDTAAICLLVRGPRVRRGAALPPSARDELLKAAARRPDPGTGPGLMAEPRKGDDAKLAE
jgi:hypothetical protein